MVLEKYRCGLGGRWEVAYLEMKCECIVLGWRVLWLKPIKKLRQDTCYITA